MVAVDAVVAASEPVPAMVLQGLLPGSKVPPKRAAIALACDRGWIEEKPGPRNSKLYSPG